MQRNINLLFIREHGGISHFVPFPIEGVTFKKLNANTFTMTLANGENKYILAEEDAIDIQKTLGAYTQNRDSIAVYPGDFNRFFLEKLCDHRLMNVLSVEARLTNLLYDNGVIFVGDLVQLTEEKLLKIENMGQGSVNAIKEFLKNNGLELGMVIPNWERYRPVK